MGPVDDEENCKDYYSRKSNSDGGDLSDFAAQQIDCQFSPEGWEADHFQYLSNEMAAEDDYLLADAFATQWMNLDGETQMVDIAGETQVLDFACETQAVSFGGETQAVDLDGKTQAVDLYGKTQTVDFDGETHAVDLAGETQAVDLDAKTQAVDLDAKTQAVDLDDETQVVDLDGETQAVDLAGETQAVDLDGETQAVDLDGETPAVDCAGDGETQAVNFAGETQAVDLTGETQAVDLAGETQALDLAGETQALDLTGETLALDLVGETQVVDLSGETQVLDDLDCMKNKPVEFLNEFNAEVGYINKREGSNKTEAVCNAQELSEDENLKIDCSDSVGPKNTVDNHHPKRGNCASGVPSDSHSIEHNSGSDFQGFTSIRTASIRASGLIALAKGASGNLCGTSSDKSSVEQQTYEQGGNNDEKSFQKASSKNCKLGSTAMRKLFTEEEDGDVDQSELDSNHTDDDNNMPDLFGSENGLAGLSYVNSEEPGELSQAHALEVVDRFLDLNVMECDENIRTRVHKVEKPKVVSVAKGSRELAKNSNIKSTDGEGGTYDWDDTREDEGGGDFFQKKKDVFFNTKQKCITEPRKRKCPEFSNVKAVGNKGDTKSGDPVYYSGSGVISHKLRSKGKPLNSGEGICQKNLTTDLEADDIGPDTQMAAEAMEILCFDVQLPDSNRNCPSKAKATRNNQSSNKIHNSERSLSTKIPNPASGGVVTRQAKRLNSANTNDNNEVSLSVKQSQKTSQRSEKKYQTRKSNQLKANGNSFDAKEEINDVISGPVLRKSRTPAKDRNAGMVRKVGSNKKCSGKVSTSNQSDSETSDEGLDASPRQICVTPPTCATQKNNVSPICKGDEYLRQTCRKNMSRFSGVNEINNLATSSPELYVGRRESRKRKDITTIRVLFSQHLDSDVVTQQKKKLARLGGAVATSMSDATHFVADEFVRTRNMLEAIACGKPVVTQLWLESCGEARCLIDEKNYILRDAKKEKEYGFCLPVSLARACQHPLLQGQKVFVTPNTKPGKDTLVSLVKAVHGLAVERLGRSVLKDEKLPDDLLILSCEEDYDICVPFLEKGGAVYSSELLLNGIVKQKLEYERHRIFADHVKRTRSTIWMKQKDHYLPVTKRK